MKLKINFIFRKSKLYLWQWHRISTDEIESEIDFDSISTCIHHLNQFNPEII